MRLTANAFTLVGSAACCGVLAGLIHYSAWPTGTNEFAAWAQVVGAILAILGAGFLASRYAEDQARIAHAENLKAAYLLSRRAGSPVVDIERWLRAGAAPNEEQVAADWDRVRNYPHAWPAWIEERYEGYLYAMARIDLKTLADGEFLDDILSVSSRLKWVKTAIGPKVGNTQLDHGESQRLSLAARDVLYALAAMRKRADTALQSAGLPSVTVAEAKPFPVAEPSKHIKAEKRRHWDEALRNA